MFFFDGYVIFGDLGSDFVTLFHDDFGPDNSNLDDEYFDYRDTKTINRVRLISWYNKSNNVKHPKKDRWRITTCTVPS